MISERLVRVGEMGDRVEIHACLFFRIQTIHGVFPSHCRMFKIALVVKRLSLLKHLFAEGSQLFRPYPIVLKDKEREKGQENG